MSSDKRNPLPPDYEEMEFAVESEDWNEYELKDGMMIKARIFLVKLVRDPNNPSNMIFESSPPKWVIYAPAHLRGKPSTDLEGVISRGRYKVPVNKTHEPWNVYKILRTGQEIKLKLAIDEVFRYKDAYDAGGCPIYNIPSGTSVLLKDNRPDQGS